MAPKPSFFAEIGLKLSDYNFDQARVILMPSTPGRYNGAAIERQGLGKLRRVMAAFNSFQNPTVTYACTSLGALDMATISEMYSCFCPNSEKMGRFRLVYPTQRYIEE